MSQKEFMQEFWQIVFTEVRKQGIQVILLGIAAWYFYTEFHELKQGTAIKIEALQNDLMACNIDRASLSKDVENLKEAVASFKLIKRK